MISLPIFKYETTARKKYTKESIKVSDINKKNIRIFGKENFCAKF